VGFTRYHHIDTEHPQFRAVWPDLVHDTSRIVEAAEARSVSVRGGRGSGPPTMTTEPAIVLGDTLIGVGDMEFPSGVIWLNGDQALEEDCETFGIWPQMNDPRENWFTKTEHCPYDVVVSAVLLRLKALAPEAARIGCDFWDDTGDAWTDGTALLADLGLAAGRPDEPPA
jgi:hypothetical protein